MKLVSDWKNAWKWWSVWGSVVAVGLSALLAALPIVRAQIPAAAYEWLTFGLTLAVPIIAALIPVLRVMKQEQDT